MIGDIVTITVDKPYGVDDEYPVKGETGVILDFDESTEQWQIATGNYVSDGWWFTKDEFRPATDDEARARLRFILMDS